MAEKAEVKNESRKDWKNKTLHVDSAEEEAWGQGTGGCEGKRAEERDSGGIKMRAGRAAGEQGKI